MAQIQFDTARISNRSVLGDIGPVVSGAELGAGATGSNTLVISAITAVRLSPSESTSTSRIESTAHSGSALGFSESQERTIGSTVYTYRPSVASFDGGRPWVRSTLPSPKPEDESAGLAEASDPLAAEVSGTGTPSEGGASNAPVAPFAKLIGEINDALSIQEIGSVTVDGQQTTEFTVSSSLEKLLSPKQLAALTKATSTLGALLSPSESPGRRAETKKHREEAANQLSLTPVQLELFIAPSGLPVRTISLFGSRSEGIGSEEDIQALEIPVIVHLPPARQTIGEARLRKLERKHSCTLISRQNPAHARSVLCIGSASTGMTHRVETR